MISRGNILVGETFSEKDFSDFKIVKLETLNGVDFYYVAKKSTNILYHSDIFQKVITLTFSMLLIFISLFSYIWIILKQKEKLFDFVFMDIQMPELDGHGVVKKYRKWEEENRLQYTPIVALSAFALENEREKSLGSGFDEHICKPVKKKECCQHYIDT